MTYTENYHLGNRELDGVEIYAPWQRCKNVNLSLMLNH